MLTLLSQLPVSDQLIFLQESGFFFHSILNEIFIEILGGDLNKHFAIDSLSGVISTTEILVRIIIEI